MPGDDDARPTTVAALYEYVQAQLRELAVRLDVLEDESLEAPGAQNDSLIPDRVALLERSVFGTDHQHELAATAEQAATASADARSRRLVDG